MEDVLKRVKEIECRCCPDGIMSYSLSKENIHKLHYIKECCQVSIKVGNIERLKTKSKKLKELIDGIKISIPELAEACSYSVHTIKKAIGYNRNNHCEFTIDNILRIIKKSQWR